MSARLLVVDDHPIFRAGLARSLAEDGGFEVVAEAGTADDAVRLAASLEPDMVLLDLSMPGGGHSALSRILEQRPGQKVLVLTASEEDEHIVRALKTGARGYVVKGVGGQELARVVDQVLAGEPYIAPTLAVRVLSELAGPRRARASPPAELPLDLTPREEDVLRRLADGMSNKKIARDLGLEEKTIKNRMTRILIKLKARNRVEAAMKFLGAIRD